MTPLTQESSVPMTTSTTKPMNLLPHSESGESDD
jgi:hypothetical protein